MSSQNPGPPAAVTYTSSGGVAEKGPLITGSTVTLQELDTSLSPTGKQYSYQITSDLGAFSPTSTFTSRYLGINATGYYFDEVQGVVSSGPVTLNGYSDLSANSTINVNILTTLATERIKKLIVDEQMTFADARTQAEREVLTALGIPTGSYEPFGTLDLRGNSDGDRILAAISSVFVNGNQAGQMSALISNVQADLGAHGTLTNQTTIAALASAASTLNCAAVAANLNQRYAQLGVTFTADDLAAWIDQNGDGLVGKFEFQVADASASSIFSVPADVVNRIAGQSVSATAGEFAINGTPVTTAVIVNSGDVLTVSPGSGPFPDGVQTVYLTTGDTKLARVSFVAGLLAITVAPATENLPKGLAQQFTATGSFSDGRSLEVTGSVSWTSSADGVASISPNGFAQTLALGSTTIAASSGVISGSTVLNVTAAVPVTLTISPSPLRTGVGMQREPDRVRNLLGWNDGGCHQSCNLGFERALGRNDRPALRFDQRRIAGHDDSRGHGRHSHGNLPARRRDERMVAGRKFRAAPRLPYRDAAAQRRGARDRRRETLTPSTKPNSAQRSTTR